MYGYSLAVLAGIPITLAVMVLTRIVLRDSQWTTAVALLLSMFACSVVGFAVLPGQLEPDEDIANGLLLAIGFFQTAYLWVVSVITLFLAGRPADWIADRLRPKADEIDPEIFE